MRGVELALGDVLDALVDRERHVVARERLLVDLPALEEEMPRAIAQAAHLFDVPAKLVVERELEPVLALPVGRDEAEHRPGELAPG